MMTVEQIIALRRTDNRESHIRDVAWCHCGGPLEFNTNGFGQVVESCPRCVRAGRMTTVAPRVANETVAPRQVAKPEPVPGPPCETCGKGIMWKGTGRKAKWCADCRPAARKELIAWHNARARALAKRMRAA